MGACISNEQRAQTVVVGSSPQSGRAHDGETSETQPSGTVRGSHESHTSSNTSVSDWLQDVARSSGADSINGNADTGDDPTNMPIRWEEMGRVGGGAQPTSDGEHVAGLASQSPPSKSSSSFGADDVFDVVVVRVLRSTRACH